LAFDTLGFYDSALSCYLQAQKQVSSAKSQQDKKRLGTTLNNLATTAYAGGDYGKALEYLEKSLAIRREIANPEGLIATLHNLGHIQLQSHEVEAALESFDEALKLALETNRRIDIFDECRDLGQLLCKIGQKEKGVPLLKQALQLGRQ
jgi:tetratricopeptide (TPR) repeat protein